MKKLEIFQELPKCDTETQSEQMLLEKWHDDWPNTGLPKTFNFCKTQYLQSSIKWGTLALILDHGEPFQEWEMWLSPHSEKPVGSEVGR